MDVDATRQEIESLISRITDPGKQADLRTRLGDLLTRHAAADAASQPAIEADIATLRSEAAAAAPAPAPPPAPPSSGSSETNYGPFLSKGGLTLVILVTLLSFGFLFYFVERTVRHELSAIESVQFLIVLTLILSMLAFGGLLIIRAMFAPYPADELQNRFRMGREIFLVFSGVFGTIIGFYFAAEDDPGAGGSAPTVELAYADGRVTAAIAGGAEPFTAIYTAPGETGGQVMNAEERVHTIEVGAVCPDEAEVAVIDGRGRRAEAKLDCGDETSDANMTNPDTNNTSAEPADNEQ
jgi:hypothetical protein